MLAFQDISDTLDTAIIHSPLWILTISNILLWERLRQLTKSIDKLEKQAELHNEERQH